MNDSDCDDTYPAQRRHLNEAIAALPSMEPQLPDGSYLTGWVLTAEFASPDGSKWFVTRRGTDGGERDLMPWTEKGLLRELLDSHAARDVAREVGRELDHRWPPDEDD